MVTSINSRVHFNYQSRFEEFQNKLRDYEKKMNLLNPVDLSIVDFRKSAHAKLSSRSIHLPSWFLFKYEDIPARFLINDMNDPRLVNPVFLNEFAGWINGKISEMGLTSFCRPADHGALQRVIKLLRDPILYEKGKDFVIGHELAHLAHSQEGFLAKAYETMSIGGIMVGIFTLILAVSITPVVHLTITVGVAGIAIAITGGSALAWFNQAKPANLSEIEEEKKADLDSVRMLNDAEGGIYYFQSSIAHHLALRRSQPAMRRDIDERGNNLNDKDHPPLTDRVAYLTQWQNSERGSNRPVA